eukprot:2042866-Rhodomonas_salina.1
MRKRYVPDSLPGYPGTSLPCTDDDRGAHNSNTNTSTTKITTTSQLLRVPEHCYRGRWRVCEAREAADSSEAGSMTSTADSEVVDKDCVWSKGSMPGAA